MDTFNFWLDVFIPVVTIVVTALITIWGTYLVKKKEIKAELDLKKKETYIQCCLGNLKGLIGKIHVNPNPKIILNKGAKGGQIDLGALYYYIESIESHNFNLSLKIRAKKIIQLHKDEYYPSLIACERTLSRKLHEVLEDAKAFLAQLGCEVYRADVKEDAMEFFLLGSIDGQNYIAIDFFPPNKDIDREKQIWRELRGLLTDIIKKMTNDFYELDEYKKLKKSYETIVSLIDQFHLKLRKIIEHLNKKYGLNLFQRIIRCFVKFDID